MKAQRANIFQVTIIFIRSFITFLIGFFVTFKANIFNRHNFRSTMDGHIRRWAKGLLKPIKASIDITPLPFEFEPHKAYIVMCNHASHYDIPLSFEALPDCSMRMLAKKELFKIPVFGTVMRMTETPSVDRKNREQAIKDISKAKAKMESGIVVWIAPEGTRSRTGKMGPFKKGGFVMAIESGASIIPMGITGAYDILPSDTWHFNLHQQVSIQVGKPIDASAYSYDDREKLMNVVEHEIRRLANQVD